MKLPLCQETADRLRSADILSGEDPLGGFAYNLDLSRPWIATAVHAGHNFRDELRPLLSIADDAQYFEEDPFTDTMIQNCPNAVWGLDSRAEYDLNRTPEDAIPLTADMFWGIEVYREKLSPEMIRRSMEKYEAFYRFFGSLVAVMMERFGFCVVYDFHAYNIGRQVAKGHDSPPVFNIGTEKLNREKWGESINSWLRNLSEISIPDVETTVAENEVFFGRGGFCKTISGWDENILVLPTEVSKVYMNEETGEPFNGIIGDLQKGISVAVNRHGREFQESFAENQSR